VWTACALRLRQFDALEPFHAEPALSDDQAHGAAVRHCFELVPRRGSLISFAVITAMFAVMFKWLPDTDVEWRMCGSARPLPLRCSSSANS
jgi:hypothetical protein